MTLKNDDNKNGSSNLIDSLDSESKSSSSINNHVIKSFANPYGVFIWYTDINKLDNMNSTSTKFLLDLLSQKEKEKVMKFHFDDDKKRSLLSVYLQKALVRYFLQLDDNNFVIERTTENKPYARCEKELGSWNYNVSHHGNYVCIVSHPSLIVGADLMDLNTRHSCSTAKEFFEMFSDQLLPSEIKRVLTFPTEEEQFTMFFVLWSLKESFVKAIGLGLGYNLHDIEFNVTFEKKDYNLRMQQVDTDLFDHNMPNWLCGSAKAKIKGVIRNDWNFDFCSLDSNHVMSIARGPLQDVIQSYSSSAWADKKTSSSVKQESIDEPSENLLNLVRTPLPTPTKKSFEELLPPKSAEKFTKLFYNS